MHMYARLITVRGARTEQYGHRCIGGGISKVDNARGREGRVAAHEMVCQVKTGLVVSCRCKSVQASEHRK